MKAIMHHGEHCLVEYGDRSVLTCAREAHQLGLIPASRRLNIGCTFFCRYVGEALYVGRKRENGNGWHDVAYLDLKEEGLPQVGKFVPMDSSSGKHADRVTM